MKIKDNGDGKLLISETREYCDAIALKKLISTVEKIKEGMQGSESK
jgi:hypothetical protein